MHAGYTYNATNEVYIIITGKFGGGFNLVNMTVDRQFSGGRNVSAVVATPETPPPITFKWLIRQIIIILAQFSIIVLKLHVPRELSQYYFVYTTVLYSLIFPRGYYSSINSK